MASSLGGGLPSGERMGSSGIRWPSFDACLAFAFAAGDRYPGAHRGSSSSFSAGRRCTAAGGCACASLGASAGGGDAAAAAAAAGRPRTAASGSFLRTASLVASLAALTRVSSPDGEEAVFCSSLECFPGCRGGLPDMTAKMNRCVKERVCSGG
jgi:hypothetical protein